MYTWTHRMRAGGAIDSTARTHSGTALSEQIPNTTLNAQ
jgi:hypothetical protein